jgi:hypothetical protein
VRYRASQLFAAAAVLTEYSARLLRKEGLDVRIIQSATFPLLGTPGARVTWLFLVLQPWKYYSFYKLKS